MKLSAATIWFGTALVAIFSLTMQLHAGDIGDKSWLLLAARMWLQGKRLYVDIMEVNPPLIIWLYGIPAGIALHFAAFKDFQALVLMGFFIGALSFFLCMKWLRLHPEMTDKNRASFGLLFCFLFLFYVNPVAFADREHLFFLLTLPYLLRWMPSLARAQAPSWQRYATGAMAGIGFCIKPHFLLMWLAVQLLYRLQQGTWKILVRAENCIVYSIGFLYLACVLCFAPDYFRSVLPMALLTYSAYRTNPVLFTAGAVFMFAITFADFRRRYHTPYRKDIYYLAGLCAAALAYALANNGWGYAYLPVYNLILVTTGFALLEFRRLRRDYIAQGKPAHAFLMGARACTINLAGNAAITIAVICIAFTHHCDHEDGCHAEEALVRPLSSRQIHSFGTLITNFALGTHVAKTSGWDWQTRYNSLWMLPQFIQSDNAFTLKHQYILRTVSHELTEDLTQKRPDVMFVDASPVFYHTGRPVDLIAYFSAYDEFKAAWQNYAFFKTVDFCTYHAQSECRYNIYVRK